MKIFGTFDECYRSFFNDELEIFLMKTTTLFTVTLASFFAILGGLVISNNVFAEGEEEPDLIAILEPTGGANDKGKGKAFFWINDDQSLSYTIVLNHVTLPGDSVSGNSPEEKGKKSWDEVEKIHIHNATGGVHQDEHWFNIIGPNDDDDMRISGQTVKGIWDSDDDPGSASMQMHQSKEITTLLDDICNEDADVNIHLHPTGYLRGQILVNSNVCSDLFP